MSGIPPAGFSRAKVGGWLTVKKEFFNRGGQDGLVTLIDHEGASLDFFTCGQCGSKACPCYASIEFWNWSELEPTDDVP